MLQAKAVWRVQLHKAMQPDSESQSLVTGTIGARLHHFAHALKKLSASPLLLQTIRMSV